jgi:TolB-like protein/DNA-binding winged helix-turn-helix (wHTH) protein
MSATSRLSVSPKAQEPTGVRATPNSLPQDPTRAAAGPVPLEPKAYQLLTFLVERRPRALSRVQIRDAIWAGTHVSESTLGVVVNAIRHALGDEARQPRFIRTVHGFGYAFCGEARESNAGREAKDTPPLDAEETVTTAPRELERVDQARGGRTGAMGLPRWRGLVVATGVLAFLVAAWIAVPLMTRDPMRRAVPAIRSIAVLPFVSLSGEPENESFSDGLSEELLNALAGIPQLRVAARTSSFQFKGKAVDVAEIGRQLHVGTILEGSVRTAGRHARISARLVKVEDGFDLWSQTYDRELEDVLAVEDEIARSLTTAVKLTLLDGRPAPISRTSNKGQNLYLQGQYLLLAWSHLSQIGYDRSRGGNAECVVQP